MFCAPPVQVQVGGQLRTPLYSINGWSRSNIGVGPLVVLQERSIFYNSCRLSSPFPTPQALSGFHPGSIILPHFRSDNGSYFDFLPSFGPVYCSAKTPSLTICARFLISFFHCLLFTSTPLSLVRPWPRRAETSEKGRVEQGGIAG